MSSPDDDEDDGPRPWMHPGDLGTILLAGVFLAAMVGTVLFIFSSPEPVRDLFARKPAAQQQNVVDVSVPPKN
jgi:hypothetical protein